MSLLSTLQLARWLGPWAGTGIPRDVVRSTEVLDASRGLRAHVYRPTGGPLRGVYLLAPGLHYLGPDDPRFDRFCRVLASAGMIVHAAFLPDYLSLRITQRAPDDLAQVFLAAERDAKAVGLPPPALFSISFGSHPAITLCAREELRGRISALVVFGGFADFADTVRFAITGRARAGDQVLSMTHDPLNAPVVWLHLIDRLAFDGDRQAIASAWRTMVERTWGQMELKAQGARDPIAHAIARTLEPRDRPLFLMGCGLTEGAEEKIEEGLRGLGDDYAWADPRPRLAKAHAPVVIVHGRDDDVIPWFEAEKLARALPTGHPHRLHVTGMYGHTGSSLPSLLDLRALGREVLTMLDVVRAMALAPSGLVR